MKHSIRHRVINEFGLPVVKIETVNGELGSGIFDKNGKEIFEGDIVKFVDEEDYTDTVRFKNGAFVLEDTDDTLEGYCSAFEVVGHADD